jgi:hypothetical protein
MKEWLSKYGTHLLSGLVTILISLMTWALITINAIHNDQIIRIIPFWIGMLLTKCLEDELIEVENDLIKMNYEKAITSTYNLGD